MSAAFDVSMGVKQGCPDNPYVFYFFFDRVQDFIAMHAPPFQHVHTSFLVFLATFILLYIDDLVLIASSTERLQ